MKNYKIESNGDNIHFASTDTSGVSSMRTLVQKKDQDGNPTQIELVAHGPGNGDLTAQTLSEVAAGVSKQLSYVFAEGKNGVQFFIKGGSGDGESKSVNANESTHNDKAYRTDPIMVKGKDDDQLLFTIGKQNEKTTADEFLHATDLYRESKLINESLDVDNPLAWLTKQLNELKINPNSYQKIFGGDFLKDINDSTVNFKSKYEAEIKDYAVVKGDGFKSVEGFISFVKYLSAGQKAPEPTDMISNLEKLIQQAES